MTETSEVVKMFVLGLSAGAGDRRRTGDRPGGLIGFEKRRSPRHSGSPWACSAGPISERGWRELFRRSR